MTQFMQIIVVRYSFELCGLTLIGSVDFQIFLGPLTLEILCFNIIENCEIKSLKIPVNGEVETHQLCELRVVEAEHAAVIGRNVLVLIDGADALAVTVGVTEDGRSYHGQLGDQVHRVLICVLLQKVTLYSNYLVS